MVSRSELATRLARNGASHAQAAHAVDMVLHEITAALVAGERVALTGFGTFEPVARAGRTARNPRTGASVQVPAATVARFHPGARLRAALQSGDAGAAPAGALPSVGSSSGGAAPADAPADAPAGPEVATTRSEAGSAATKAPKDSKGRKAGKGKKVAKGKSGGRNKVAGKSKASGKDKVSNKGTAPGKDAKQAKPAGSAAKPRPGKATSKRAH